MGGGTYPQPNEIQYYDTLQTRGILFVDPIHAGKLLSINVQAVNNVITASYMKSLGAPIGTIEPVNNQTYKRSEGWLASGLNGDIISANRFEFIEYNNWSVANNDPYGRTAGNPNTPYLTEHVLRGKSSTIAYTKPIGQLENKIVFPKVGFRHLLYREFPTDDLLFIQGNTNGSSKNNFFQASAFGGLNGLAYNIYGRPNFNSPFFGNTGLQNKTIMSDNDLSSPYLSVQYYIKVDGGIV